MVKLENEFLQVSISSKGAELTSVFSKKNQTEYLWQGDPAVWPWHAPNLFPVIGACQDSQLLVDGKTYPIERHGFTRTSVFRRVESTPVHAKFSLHFNDATLAAYPYKFEFQVLYDLFDNQIRVSYKVINLDAGTIYFSVGAHPAFNVPFAAGQAYEDYYLEFEQVETLQTHLLTKEGLFTGEIREVVTDGSRLFLTKTIFDQDALVFKNLRSRKISLKSRNQQGSLYVAFPYFNYLGLWAKPGAPFVCIEPWLGCADTAGKHEDIRNKEAIQQVEHGHVFETDFLIGVEV